MTAVSSTLFALKIIVRATSLFLITTLLRRKANRVAQTTFVVAPSQETVAPVYCVERNRWGYSGNKDFEKSAQKMGPKARQVKMQMLRSEVSASAVQSSVWDEVDELSDKFASYNNTSDLAQVLAQQDFEEETRFGNFLKKVNAMVFL